MAFRASFPAPPGRAALDLVEPRQLASPVTACLCPLGESRARLHTHTRPLVPEGPHGDAVLPHKAPHSAATALHAWLEGSGRPRAHGAALRPWSALGRGLALRSLPSSWWEEERKDQSLGRRSAGSTGPRRSQPPALQSPGSCSRPSWLSGPRAPDPAAPAQPCACFLPGDGGGPGPGEQ